jgi:GNAT superfamily N-acetyltransferase
LNDLAGISIAVGERFLFARQGDRVLGLIGAVAQPGGVGLVFPPEVDAADRASLGGLLIASAIERLRRAGCAFAQLVLTPTNSDWGTDFECKGFRKLTEALMLERSLALPIPPPQADLTARFADIETDVMVLESLIGRINQGARDCPELDRLRTPSQILQGHRAVIEAEGGACRIYRSGADDCGLAVWTVREAEAAAELIFLGVVPDYRGRGHGIAMLIDFLRAAAPDCRLAQAAVDSRNHYAIRCYNAMKFESLASAEVWIHDLSLSP